MQSIITFRSILTRWNTIYFYFGSASCISIVFELNYEVYHGVTSLHFQNTDCEITTFMSQLVKRSHQERKHVIAEL